MRRCRSRRAGSRDPRLERAAHREPRPISRSPSAAPVLLVPPISQRSRREGYAPQPDAAHRCSVQAIDPDEPSSYLRSPVLKLTSVPGRISPAGGHSIVQLCGTSAQHVLKEHAHPGGHCELEVQEMAPSQKSLRKHRLTPSGVWAQKQLVVPLHSSSRFPQGPPRQTLLQTPLSQP
jgi:hypothetical protein